MRNFAGISIGLLVIFLPYTVASGAPPWVVGQEGTGVAGGGVIPDHVSRRLLVKFKPGVSQGKQNAVLAEKKAKVVDHISGIDVQVIELPPQANENAYLNAFRNRGEVEFAEFDQIAQAVMVPNDAMYDQKYMPHWHLPKIGCPAAWNITTGDSNVIIAIGDDAFSPDYEDVRTVSSRDSIH